MFNKELLKELTVFYIKTREFRNTLRGN